MDLLPGKIIDTILKRYKLQSIKVASSKFVWSRFNVDYPVNSKEHLHMLVLLLLLFCFGLNMSPYLGCMPPLKKFCEKLYTCYMYNCKKIKKSPVHFLYDYMPTQSVHCLFPDCSWRGQILRRSTVWIGYWCILWHTVFTAYKVFKRCKR